MTSKKIKTDIIIIGAGIAGLWLHHRLNDLGYHALLIEKNSLGSQQTLSSQGIIHGGAKYTLNGIFSHAASAIADMPKRWLDCIAGHGDIDLAQTKILSHHQLMWSTQGLSSKLTAFFASKALNGKMLPLTKAQYPSVFQHPRFKGDLYQLNEPVLDVPSLIKNLSHQWRQRILQTTCNIRLIRNHSGMFETTILYDANHREAYHIDAKELILTSGEGNEALLQELNINTPKMQRRPLQMVLAKGNLPALYAHCIGASQKPIATITTHSHTDGDNIWYIGGDIAENGVNTNQATLIDHTKAKLNKILPWVSLENTDWTTHCVNRAEPAQKNQARPDTAFLESINNIHISWPTKLALTPNLSDQVIETLSNRNMIASDAEMKNNTDITLQHVQQSLSPTISPSLWERAFDAKS